MIASLRAETRKLLTVRSTYFILGIVLLLVFFFAFYVSGWRIDKLALLNPYTLQDDVTASVMTVSVFSALVAVLLVTHEYRYNTIMHTLTLSNSRTKVLLSKILVISAFSLLFTALFGALSPVLVSLGVHAHNLHLVPQTFDYGSLIWRSLFFGWGYTMAGLLIAFLIRNQVGAIITLFVAPNTVEGLLGLLLKQNVVYLPFSSLSVVLGRGVNYNSSITPIQGLLVFCGYLVVTFAVTWFLFLRRDAN